MHVNVCAANTRPCQHHNELAATIFQKRGSVLRNCEPAGLIKGSTMNRLARGIDGVALKYHGTEPCLMPDGQLQTVSTIIHFMCAPDGGPAGGKPESVHHPNECEYVVLWPSKHGCGSVTKTKLGGDVVPSNSSLLGRLENFEGKVAKSSGWSFVFL
jgi:hypothetical protein